VDANAHVEIDAVAVLHFGRERLHLALDGEPRGDGPARRILQRQGRAEERHHPVAEELVDRSLVVVDLAEDQGEAAVHELVHHLGAHSLGQVRGVDEVAKEHRHVLALAFERGACLQDAIGQVLRRVGTRVGRR